MDVWRILVFGIATVLALKSLIGLMTIHRQNYLQQVLAEEKRKNRERKKLAEAQAAAAEEQGNASPLKKGNAKSSAPASTVRR